MAAKNKPNEIYIIRNYDAPVKTIWEAWTDPEKVAQWWGPRGFTLTTMSKDLRTGGSWVYTMHGPDGVDYPNVTKYLEVEKYSRMVYDHGGSADRPPMFRVTVQFTEANGKTKMEMTMALPTAEAAAQTKKFIKKAGGDSTWDRLGEYLEKNSSGREKFFINRSFAVPLEKMFEMWTNPEHLAKWVSPTGFEMKFIRSEIAVGSTTFSYMTDGKNIKMYARASYLEISKPNRIVYTQQFCDENEKLTRHPMSATWPETMLTTLTLSEEGSSQTRITICWEPFGNVTPEEMATFVMAKSGMTQGWTGSFDKLDSYLGTSSSVSGE